MKIIQDGWTIEGRAQVACNVNALLGPAPGGYLQIGNTEVIITPDEMREMWDAYAEFIGMGPRP